MNKHSVLNPKSPSPILALHLSRVKGKIAEYNKQPAILLASTQLIWIPSRNALIS